MSGGEATRSAIEDAVARERQRIARELHDQVASDLAGSIALIKQRISRDPGLEPVLTALEGALAGLRETIQSLRPRRLGAGKLEEELRNLSAEVGRLYGIRVELWTGGTEDLLSQPQREVVYQVTREALTNVRKHAQTSICRIRLGFAAHPFLIEVSDEGRGFDANQGLGYGIIGMRERAAGIGARLEVVSTPGRGTTVFLFGPDATA